MLDQSLAAVDCESIVIDDSHLGRMTLGDRHLEREVLAIFARQCALMLARMNIREPAQAGAAAHTLKGSARGIGAWRVAQAAERCERASAQRSEMDLATAIADLRRATDETRAVIDERLAGVLEGVSAA